MGEYYTLASIMIPREAHSQDPNNEFVLRARWMSPQEVLTILNDEWRLLNGIEPGLNHPDMITRGTSAEVAANRIGIPKLADSWADIAVTLKHLFQIDVPRESWQEVLDPPRKKTIGPVCDFIADHTAAPMIERDVGGAPVEWHDAAFRAILAIFDDRGIDRSGIRPETMLQPMLRKHYWVFVHIISRLAPGRMPPLRFRTLGGFLHGTLIAVLIALVLIVFALLVAPAVVRFGGVTLTFIAVAFLARKHFTAKPKSVIRTFADLCKLLTNPPPEQQQPMMTVDDEPIAWDVSYHPHVYRGYHRSSYYR